MKQILCFSMLILFVMMQQSYGQVSINTDGVNPPPSAMLEVKSTDKGFLPPRMTTVQRNSIENPAEGLNVYNTDKKMMEVFDGSRWVQFEYPISNKMTCGQDFRDVRD
ncbi:MAG: hypothetical protein NTU44_13915 [Bacteroidetes bacterium]|nr:hypothetical protein [Bacteroidota bacterium]